MAQAFLAILLASSGLLLWVSQSLAVVTLVDFSATGRDTDILIEWETASELNTAFFAVLRSTSENGEYSEIFDFIEPEGDQLSGWEYSKVDETVQIGVTYWYKLEAYEFGTDEPQVFGPEQAAAGVLTPTGTLTPTASFTPEDTITPTPTLGTGTTTLTLTPTRTRTRTNTPRVNTAITLPSATFRATNTPLPAQPSATWTPTPIPAVPTATRIPGEPIATLIPLPSITFVVALGSGEDEAPPPAAVEEAPPEDPVQDAGDDGRSWFTPKRLLVIGTIAAIWIVLGGWFFITMRRLDV